MPAGARSRPFGAACETAAASTSRLAIRTHFDLPWMPAAMGMAEDTMSNETTGTTRRREILLAASAAGVAAPGVVLAQALPGAAAPQSTAAPASAAAAARAVDSVREPILRISREVWANAERSLAEEKSAAIHVRELQAAGFRVTTGTANIPTAFLAEWSQGTGGPVIAFLPEYDALPGLGNAAEPRQTPGPTGVEVGHGCGHNLLGAGCTGAAFALKRMMEQDRTPGTIRVFGCAAEEGGAVKVYFVREKLFDDVDAAIAWHPAPIAAAGAISTAANNGMKIRFHGRTAHAGVEPWAGRSALKAAELFAHGINLMREHVQPTARIHYIYENAGSVMNIVPDLAEVWLTIRDRNRESVVAMSEWAKQIAEGAAMATQTRAEFEVFVGLHQLLPNDALIAAVHRHMSATPLEWTAEEQTFARTIQKAMNLPERGLAERVLPVLGEITTGGGSDCGDVSFVTPTILFGWPTLPQGVSLHTWGVTACGGMSIGEKGALAAARIMAGLGHDLMTNADLRGAAKADLERRRGDYRYVSPLPPDQRQPPGIPERLLKTGDDDVVSPMRTMPAG
jgi:aminobenzoyl-glutamate utilization protein B